MAEEYGKKIRQIVKENGQEISSEIVGLLTRLITI